MDKKRNPSGHGKRSLTPELEKKLDKLADDIQQLPENRKKHLKKELKDKSEAGVPMEEPPRKTGREERRTQLIKELSTKRLFNANEVADILDVSLSTVRRMLDVGAITAIPIGETTIRFRAAEIERILGHSDKRVDFLSLGEVAKLLNVSIAHVRRLVLKGLIKSIKLHETSKYRVEKSEVERILSEGISTKEKGKIDQTQNEYNTAHVDIKPIKG